METTLAAEIESGGPLDEFVEELTSALARRGVSLAAAPVVDRSEERVILEWQDGDRTGTASRPAPVF